MKLTDLNECEAKDFFMESQNYGTLELPDYFAFTNVLSAVQSILPEAPLSDKATSKLIKSAKETDRVNYTLIHNKDGKYAWRPLQLIHPVLYVALVNEITTTSHWQALILRFKRYEALPKIHCTSIPRIQNPATNQKQKAYQLRTWWSEYASFDRVDLAIGCSQSVVDTFLTQHPGPYHKPTTVIHNIVNVQSALTRSCEAQTVAWKKNTTLKILSVGRLCDAKNFKAIPAILYALKQKADTIAPPPCIDWLVLGAGETYRAQCQAEVQRWHVEDHVRFIGSQANPFPYMKSCDLYVQPSRFEGWPMTTTEARALGCAIVASDLPCFREQLGEEPDCRLASPDNPEAFAEQMLLLLRTTTHAPSKMIQRCSPQAVVAAFKKVILS